MILDRLERTTGQPSPTRNKKVEHIEPSEYSEENYLSGMYQNVAPAPEIKDLYYKLRSTLLDSFDRLEMKQRKKYVGFYSKEDGSAVCTIEVQKKKLILRYSTDNEELLPPSDFVKKYVKGHWGIGDFQSEIRTDEDVSRVIELVRRVHEKK